MPGVQDSIKSFCFVFEIVSQYVVQADLGLLGDPSASASRVLGLQVCIIMPSSSITKCIQSLCMWLVSLQSLLTENHDGEGV